MDYIYRQLFRKVLAECYEQHINGAIPRFQRIQQQQQLREIQWTLKTEGHQNNPQFNIFITTQCRCCHPAILHDVRICNII